MCFSLHVYIPNPILPLLLLYPNPYLNPCSILSTLPFLSLYPPILPILPILSLYPSIPLNLSPSYLPPIPIQTLNNDTNHLLPSIFHLLQSSHTPYPTLPSLLPSIYPSIHPYTHKTPNPNHSTTSSRMRLGIHTQQREDRMPYPILSYPILVKSSVDQTRLN